MAVPVHGVAISDDFYEIISKYSQIDRYLAPSALGRGWDNGIVVVYSRYIGVYVFHVFFLSTRYLPSACTPWLRPLSRAFGARPGFVWY